jgi:hypothetical protein
LTSVKASVADVAHPSMMLHSVDRAVIPMGQHRLTLTRRDAFAALFAGLGSGADITMPDGINGAAEATDDRRKSGYCESESVRTYYAVNRS